MEAKRWDPIVKLTHWGIVAAVIGNALVTGEGSGWHIWVGYGLAALLALRLLWGLVGPREARFSTFPPSLARASDHLSEIRRGEVTVHASHNPLGALMAYAVWGTLLVVAGTGIAMSGPPPANPSEVRGEEGSESKALERVKAGEDDDERTEAQIAVRDMAAASLASAPKRGEPETEEQSEERSEADERHAKAARADLAPVTDPDVVATRQAVVQPDAGKAETEGEMGEEEEGPLSELHELAVNLLYVLIALHLLGVLFESRRSGPGIVRAMLPGGR